MFVLDTNVLSAMMRLHLEPEITAWVGRQRRLRGLWFHRDQSVGGLVTSHLPMVIESPSPGGLSTPLPETHLIPTLVTVEGERASWRYGDFFMSNIRNPNFR